MFFSLPILAQAAMAYMQYDSAEKDRTAVKNANSQNISLQKEFAQKGIQWRVEDAKQAGIHPLAALGASTHNPSFNVMPETGSQTGSLLKALHDSQITKLQQKDMESDIVLKMAQASRLNAETEKMNSGPRPMWTQMFDNNPDSPTHGELVWVPDPESNWAEQMESGAGFWGGLYSNVSSTGKKIVKSAKSTIIGDKKVVGNRVYFKGSKYYLDRSTRKYIPIKKGDKHAW